MPHAVSLGRVEMEQKGCPLPPLPGAPGKPGAQVLRPQAPVWTDPGGGMAVIWGTGLRGGRGCWLGSELTPLPAGCQPWDSQPATLDPDSMP